MGVFWPSKPFRTDINPRCPAMASLVRHPRSWLLAHTHVVVGWMFNITFSLALVYASTWLVVNVAPEAAGAGVSEIMAYLNGCFIPKARSQSLLLLLVSGWAGRCALIAGE